MPKGKRWRKCIWQNFKQMHLMDEENLSYQIQWLQDIYKLSCQPSGKQTNWRSKNEVNKLNINSHKKGGFKGCNNFIEHSQNDFWKRLG